LEREGAREEGREGGRRRESLIHYLLELGLEVCAGIACGPGGEGRLMTPARKHPHFQKGFVEVQESLHRSGRREMGARESLVWRLHKSAKGCAGEGRTHTHTHVPVCVCVLRTRDLA
jgi:hypothetical protein